MDKSKSAGNLTGKSTGRKVEDAPGILTGKVSERFTYKSTGISSFLICQTLLDLGKEDN